MLKLINKIFYHFGFHVQIIKITKKSNENKKVKKDIANKQAIISNWAKQYGYIVTNHSQTYSNLENGTSKIDIYFKPLTVITTLVHPKKGETKLRRENIPFREVEDIIRNPREHLGRKSNYCRLIK